MSEATEAEYEKAQDAAEEALRPHLTDEFLETLVLAVRTVGWSEGDFTEFLTLVEAIYRIADKKPPPDVEPLVSA